PHAASVPLRHRVAARHPRRDAVAPRRRPGLRAGRPRHEGRHRQRPHRRRPGAPAGAAAGRRRHPARHLRRGDRLAPVARADRGAGAAARARAGARAQPRRRRPQGGPQGRRRLRAAPRGPLGARRQQPRRRRQRAARARPPATVRRGPRRRGGRHHRQRHHRARRLRHQRDRRGGGGHRGRARPQGQRGRARDPRHPRVRAARPARHAHRVGRPQPPADGAQREEPGALRGGRGGARLHGAGARGRRGGGRLRRQLHLRAGSGHARRAGRRRQRPSRAPRAHPRARDPRARGAPHRPADARLSMRDDAVALLACLLSGFLLTLALPPNGWWPLAFAIVPLFVAVARATRGRTALLAGGAFGLSFFAVYVLWLPRSFAVLFGPAFWVVFPLMVALLALFWGLTCWASWRRAGGRAGRAPGAAVLLVLPVAWVLVEWARTQGYFAFPWGALGYAWLDQAPGQLAEHVGVYGLSLLVTASAALLAWPWAGVRPTPPGERLVDLGVALAALAALLGLAFWQGATLLPAPDAVAEAPLTALLVQGNVDPFARATSAARELEVHLSLTRE